MSNTTRCVILHAALAALLSVSAAVPSRAQATTPGIAPAPDEPDFLTRYDFHLSAAALDISDPRFSWETHFGGDLDVFDYVVGRTSMIIDYEAVLGNEFRAFDPNQGNYILEASSSARIQPSGTEVAGYFHHESQHLSDRPKRFAVAWNILGARALQRVTLAGTTIDVVVSGGKIVQNSFVDYTWNGEVDLVVRHALTPRLGVFAHGFGSGYLVDPTIANRGRLAGGMVEVGVRINGRVGAMELFVGAEHRIDANPIDRTAQEWALAGFRLVNK